MNTNNTIKELKPLSEIFKNQNPSHAGEKIHMIKIHDIDDFPGHTFEIHQEDEDFQRLLSSIKETGIESPLILLKKDTEFGYYCISGHRRRQAASILGFDIVPAVIKDYDMETAVNLMIQSNLTQRSKIRPSEWLACILSLMPQSKSKSEKEGGKVSAHIGDFLKISSRQVETYLSLQNLHEEWMELLNEETLSLSSAEKLSHLSLEGQTLLCHLCSDKEYTPSLKNSADLLLLEKDSPLTTENISSLLWGKKETIKSIQKGKITFRLKRFSPYLPDNIPKEEIENYLIKILKEAKEKTI